MATLEERRAAFAALHASGCFVIPNPWDAGSARFLAHPGFRALATTSAGFQFSHGRPDSVRGASRDRSCGTGPTCCSRRGHGRRGNCRAIVSAVAPKPVNAIVMTEPALTVAEMAAVGVRPISVGSSLARVAWAAFARAAGEIATHGSFDGLAGAMPFGEPNATFAGWEDGGG